MVEVCNGETPEMRQDIFCRLERAVPISQELKNILVERSGQGAGHPHEYVLFAVFVEVPNVYRAWKTSDSGVAGEGSGIPFPESTVAVTQEDRQAGVASVATESVPSYNNQVLLAVAIEIAHP